jgi:CO/xanthine dehydrogenase FAD-binding subunit
VKAFAYVNPANEQEVVAALSRERGRVLPLAGGMDLIALMKDYIAQPERWSTSSARRAIAAPRRA